MTDHIATAFTQLGITITPTTVQNMSFLVTRFETRGSAHPLTLNSQVFGVHPIAFKDEDRAAFFDLFGIREDALKKIVAKIPSINPNFIVASDPFNLLAVWVVHLSYALVKNKAQQEAFALDVMKYLYYRFFTSLVNHFFPHGANERIMQATIDGLTMKYDIVRFGTWKRVIEERSKDLLGKQSIHLNTLQTGRPDDKYLYVITDTQTRIRDRVKNIVSAYYEARASGAEVRGQAAIAEGEEEKFLVEHVSSLDAMVTNVFAEVLNVRTFVEPRLVADVSRQFSAINAASLSHFLQRVSLLTKEQATAKQLDMDIITHRDGTRTVGMRKLTRDIIQGAYRYAIRNRIPLDRKAELYIRLKNVYASSRISDASINSVKDRAGILVEALTDTNRQATKASMRLAYISYVILRSFKHI